MTFRALVLRESDKGPSPTIEALSEEDLPAGNVTIDVQCSSLNYKDGMVIKGLGRLVRNYPHVPGIDFAGAVRASEDPRFKVGDEVVLTGWRVGEIHWGGFAGRARVNGDWLVKLPNELSARDSMAIGTAGLTSMLAIMTLEKAGMAPSDRPVLVTGAGGGVGSVAVALLAQFGYRVEASTGRPSLHGYLQGLGASAIVDRAELAEPQKRPLGSERWQAAIDTVGSHTLANVLSQIAYGGGVAACGLAGGADLPASVMPFLLRGVSLLGVDSVMCPLPSREAAWARLARDLNRDALAAITHTASLSELPALADEILAGRVKGRTVIDLTQT